MKIECHILQNFPPHCLNRDDTNSPKDCEFGGVRRGRISSQCLKRAVRDQFELNNSFNAEQRAVRTKRVVEQAAKLLADKGRAFDAATVNIAALLAGAKLKTEAPKNEGDQPKTQYLLYLPQRKLQELANIVDEHWDALSQLAGVQSVGQSDETEKPSDKAKKEKKGKKEDKKDKAADVPKEAKDAVTKLFRDAKQTPEIALFGRMIADNPDWNVEAACQVAHAISTHRISMEFDFFTAVDDLKKDSDTGSDMMGTVQFNSACFYRYAVVDVDGLQANLGGQEQAELTRAATRAFLQAFVHARPTGKQNSMAANTLPSLVLFTVRDGGQALSLVNAFSKPVVVRGNLDLESGSSEQLSKHFADLRKMYPNGLVAAHACSLDNVEWGQSVTTHESVDAAIAAACSALVSKAQAA